ncbi:hypothetical protein JL100_034340 (plasmid) [Skermanella mucosa]|uniref:hypothetical protein n=1 Tax=Skermanella mucosa TaxID=1789672 RepID=UPI00192A968F|nr:hypothetical protein [Skermanella mucosa]UEM24821.1 hypothetical protein JL100_034340 [Skermanella mucosa]
MAGQGRNDDTDPNKVFPGDASGVTSQDTTGSAARPHSAQGEGNGPVDMTAAIDKAKDMTAGDLPKPDEKLAEEEANRIKRAAGHMSTGNTPQAGDDPQHRTNTPMSPMPAETGGKGNVGDTPVKDAGPQR